MSPLHLHRRILHARRHTAGSRRRPWIFTVGLAIAVTASTTVTSGHNAAPPVQDGRAAVPAGLFQSILPASDSKADSALTVAAFRMDRVPVTNAQYLRFVQQHPQWQRGRSPRLFVDEHYLASWHGPTDLGPAADPQQPVAAVSWFAARAYCEAQGARLPDWVEWEYVAAADETRRDARAAPAWQQRILNWYSHPSNSALARVGAQPANVYGVRDMHGLIWEWVEDFNALLVSGDTREAGDKDVGKFCGAGALSLANPQEYAVAMRVAMLSSLHARDTTANLGFRCASR